MSGSVQCHLVTRAQHKLHVTSRTILTPRRTLLLELSSARGPAVSLREEVLSHCHVSASSRSTLTSSPLEFQVTLGRWWLVRNRFLHHRKALLGAALCTWEDWPRPRVWRRSPRPVPFVTFNDQPKQAWILVTIPKPIDC